MGCPWSKYKTSGDPAQLSDISMAELLPPGTNRPYYLNDKNTVISAKDYAAIEIDPRIPFSNREVFKLMQSWRGIKRNISNAGVEMFVLLFKTNASLQKMFQGFKDIRSDDELRSNEALEYHATLVMTTLDDAITHIDNYEYVRQLLQKTGASHVKFTNFHPDNFLAIKEPFLEAVKVTLGDRYTENMQNIYTIAITFILQSLVGGITEALAKEQEEKRGSNGVV